MFGKIMNFLSKDKTKILKMLHDEFLFFIIFCCIYWFHDRNCLFLEGQNLCSKTQPNILFRRKMKPKIYDFSLHFCLFYSKNMLLKDQMFF